MLALLTFIDTKFYPVLQATTYTQSFICHIPPHYCCRTGYFNLITIIMLVFLVQQKDHILHPGRKSSTTAQKELKFGQFNYDMLTHIQLIITKESKHNPPTVGSHLVIEHLTHTVRWR